MINLNDAGERAAAVGEYVLGTLSAEDREAIGAALPQDRSLLAEVYHWQDKLLGLTTLAAPATPPAALWLTIEGSLGVAAVPRPASARDVVPLPKLWWRRLELWQGLSVAGVAASLLFAFLLLARIGVSDTPGARYLAVLQSPDNQATGYIVELEVGRNLRLIPVAQTAAVPAGRALQFWTKPQEAAGPTSLGLVRPGQVLELPVSRLPAVEAQQLFEITLEPESGSPLDRPTGPILYVGRTVAL